MLIVELGFSHTGVDQWPRLWTHIHHLEMCLAGSADSISLTSLLLFIWFRSIKYYNHSFQNMFCLLFQCRGTAFISPLCCWMHAGVNKNGRGHWPRERQRRKGAWRVLRFTLIYSFLPTHQPGVKGQNTGKHARMHSLFISYYIFSSFYSPIYQLFQSKYLSDQSGAAFFGLTVCVCVWTHLLQICVSPQRAS